MAEARHGTLVPNTVASVTLSGNYNEVMVVNRNGAGELYFTVDGSTPTIGGADTAVLAAGIGRMTAKSPSQATTVVKLISASLVQYSVRGVEPWGATNPVLFTPPTLSGLYLWFAADRITNTAAGAAVASWSDNSGNGLHAAQATGSAQPTYRTGAIGGLPALQFDGGDYLETTTFTAVAQTTTFAVIKHTSTAGSQDIIDGFFGVGRHQFGIRSGVWDVYQGNPIKYGPTADTNAHVLAGVFTGTSGSYMTLDGTPTPTASIGANTITKFTVGGSGIGPGNEAYFGYLAEVVCYSRVLSTTERQQVERYLANKYSIQLRTSTSALDTIPSLQVRYAADEIVGLSDGAAVSSWLDASYKNFPLTQSTGSKQPAYKTNILNGKPVVRFDGVDDSLGSAALGFTLAQPNTLVVVAKLNQHPGALNRVIFDGVSTNRNVLGDSISLSTGSFLWALWQGSAWYGHAVADLNWHVFVAHFNGASSWIRVDGHHLSFGGNGTNALGGFTLGSDNAGSQCMDGDIAEVAVFNPALSLDQVRLVERALASKWGLAVPSFSPVELDGVVARFEAGNVNASPDAAVSAWSDTLGKVTDAAQSTAGSRPVLKANAYQNRPTVLFDGTDDHLRADQLSQYFSGNDKPFTVVVVCRPNVNSLMELVGVGSNATSNPGIQMGLQTGAFYLLKRDDASSGAQTGPTISSSVTANPQTMTFISTGTTATIRRNGVELAAGVNLDVGQASMNQVAIGALPRATTTTFFNGDIAEVVFYNRPLTTAEAQQVEQFLDAKYEITSRATTLPTSLSGLRLWVEADKISATDGLPIKTWPDSSGNANHATQATGTKQPLYKTNIINGKPVLRFDGTDDFLADGTGLTLTSGFTMAVVIRPVTVALAAIVSIYDGSAQNRLQFSQLADGSITSRVWSSSTSYIGRVTPVGQLANGTPTVLVIDYDGGTTAASVSVFRNGVQVDSADGNAGSFTSAGSSTKTFEIAGQFGGAGGTCFNGDFAAALVWLRRLTETERNQLTSFLGAKYGISVTASTSFAPDQLSGLAAWYSADRIPGLTDGASVATWADISGNTRHATQATGGQQPTYRTGVLNGRPVVRFDGTDDWLATASFTALAQPNTVIVVARHAAFPGSFNMVIDGINVNNRHAIYAETSGTKFRLYFGNAAILGPARDTNWHLWTAAVNDTSSFLRQDGVVFTGSSGTHTLTGIRLGADHAGTNVLNGDIAEVLVYDTLLSSSEIQQVEAYLAAKYGITVT